MNYEITMHSKKSTKPGIAELLAESSLLMTMMSWSPFSAVEIVAEEVLKETAKEWASVIQHDLE